MFPSLLASRAEYEKPTRGTAITKVLPLASRFSAVGAAAKRSSGCPVSSAPVLRAVHRPELERVVPKTRSETCPRVSFEATRRCDDHAVAGMRTMRVAHFSAPLPNGLRK